MKKITTLIILGFLLTAATISAAEQLLVNPRFEEDGLSGWTVNYNQSNWGTVSTPEYKKVARCFWDGGMRQLVSVTPGKSYELTGNVSVPEGGAESGWGCWLSLDWYDADENKIGTAWSVGPHESGRGKWNDFSSGKCKAPNGAAFACVDFGVWQSDSTPAKPMDFANFSLEEVK